MVERGKIASKFAELNDDVLFGKVWSREDKVSLHGRSMITISDLMAHGLFLQLKSQFYNYWCRIFKYLWYNWSITLYLFF